MFIFTVEDCIGLIILGIIICGVLLYWLAVGYANLRIWTKTYLKKLFQRKVK